MKKAVRWIVRSVLGVIGLLVLVIGGALIFVHTDYGRDYVRRKAETALLGAFPGGAHIGRISGSVFGTLVIDDLRLDGRDGKPMISVGTARVKLALPALAGHVARLERLQLEDVTVDQHPQPPAPPEPESPNQGGSSWTVEIPRARILRGHVMVTSATGTTIDLHDLDAEANITLDDGAVAMAVHALGTSDGAPVETTALLGYRDGVVAAPLAMATLDQGSVIALGISTGPRLDGVIRATVPAATVKRLAGITLPGDANLMITAIDGNVDAQVVMAGAIVRALVEADLAAKTVKGLVIADVVDATRLDPRIAGGGIATASIDATMERVRGILTVDGMYRVDKEVVGQAKITGATLVAFDAAVETGAWLLVEGGADLGKARLTAILEVDKEKQQQIYTLKKSTVIATARHVGARKTDVEVGSITASLRASGPLWPKPELKISGTLGGDALRAGDLSVATIDVAVNVAKRASGHLELGGVRKAGQLLGSASLDARGGFERTPLGNIISIDLDDHSITTASNGTWAGSGGTLILDPTKVTLAGFHTGSGEGKFTIDLAFTKATKDLRAKVDAKTVQLATLTPAVKGMASAQLAVERRGGRWSGGGHVAVAKFTLPNQPIVDVDGHVKLTGRRVELDTIVTGDAGAVALVADVEGPSDLTDPHAWKRLDRRAITELAVAVTQLDLAKLGRAKLQGVIDGKLAIEAKSASGDLHVGNIVTQLGTVDGDLSLSPSAANIDAGVRARLDGVELVAGTATLALPIHPFDPAAWTQLGKRVLQHADIAVKPTTIDPALLARFKIDAPYHARAEARVVATEGARSITVSADLHELDGGIVKKPIEVHAETTLDDTGLSVGGNVRVGKVTLVTVAASSPLSVDTLAAWRTMRLTGLVNFPTGQAKELVAVIGRGDVTGGTFGGTVKLAGVLGQPTIDGDLEAMGIEIPASLAGRKPALLRRLGVQLGWDGALAKLHVFGLEPDGALLDLEIHGDPRHRETVVAKLSATAFDIAPVTAFATGVVSAARGTIDADLTLQGVDPDTGDAHGSFQIKNGRFPLSPMLGTLRGIEADVQIINHTVTLTKLEGKLGKGEVHATANLALVGSLPTKFHADATLKGISLVRAMQPTIGATVKIDLANGGTQWTGDIDVTGAHVEIAKAGGAKLLEASLPDDIVFIDEAPQAGFQFGSRVPPSLPWLIASIHLRTTALEIIQEQFQIRGSAAGELSLSLGSGELGLDGSIDAQRGDIDLLGSRSILERGEVIFDGTVDPLLNIRVIRELETMSITAQVSGRASKPEVELSSDSGTYTQGELYSYFIGGQAASGSNAAQAGEAAGAGYASSVLSAQLRNQLQKRLGIDLHLDFNYEVGTATSSDAIRVGYWYSPKLFLAGRSHYDARVDENSNEVLFEYHLRGNTVLQGNLGDRGYDGIDYVKRWHW